MKKTLLVCAGLLVVSFLVCHAAGFRESTSVLSGTYPAVAAAAGAAVAGLAYAAVYMASVILVPILALGAGVLFLLERGFGARE